jgi:uncharacterized protein (DUF433 family)
MKKPISKYIYLETEINELRFVGTRIPIIDALHYVSEGRTFETISKEYGSVFPPEAVAEAVIEAINKLTAQTNSVTLL